jgi:peptide-methionine (S)-S-oxide reductase
MADHGLATFGGGCFWCIEAVFKELEGVEEVTSGYSGGDRRYPSYEQVCSGATGHAEVVQIRFDPERISYRELLKVFFTVHDPTQKNRQGNDVGPQYRSVIFYHSPDQKQTAESVIQELEEAKLWPRPVVTELAPLREFYPAERYHQDYFRYNPEQPYCQIVIQPKVAKFREQFAQRLKGASRAR